MSRRRRRGLAPEPAELCVYCLGRRCVLCDWQGVLDLPASALDHWPPPPDRSQPKPRLADLPRRTITATRRSLADRRYRRRGLRSGTLELCSCCGGRRCVQCDWQGVLEQPVSTLAEQGIIFAPPEEEPDGELEAGAA